MEAPVSKLTLAEGTRDMTGRLADPTKAKQYIKGGHATITLRSVKTGNRYTYKIEVSEDGKVHWVRVLVGSDNESNFKYLGMIDRSGTFAPTKRTKVALDSPSYLAFEWTWNRALAANHMPRTLEVWHEGRCARCGRKLTVPTSIATGFGPECASKAGV